MHSFTSIIFCLSLQHVSLQSTSKPLHCGIESPPGPWALQFPIPGCRWPHVAAVSKQLKSHPCCWINDNSFCADPFFLLGGMAAYIWERERWEAAGGFLFPMYFFIQAVFGVDCICRHHNCLDCFYQRVSGKNGLLLSPPQHFQISQCRVHLLSSAKPTKRWNFKPGIFFFLSGFLLLLLLFAWFFSLYASL